MPKCSTPPDVLAEALALREAGFTTLSISQRLGISIRSLNRHFAAHGIKKGKMKKDLLAKARTDLIRQLSSNEALRDEIGQLINDNIAHAKHLRSILVEASEHMKATSLREVVLVARAAAAYGTAIKATSDAIRSILPMEKLNPDAPEDLPELVVTVLTDADIERIKASDRLLD